MKFESNQFGGNERAKEQYGDKENGGYQDKYYDENESREGQEKYDLGTGKRFKNDKDALPESIKKVSEKELTENDQIIKELADDVTTKWLLDNGFDEYGNEKPKKAA